MKVDKNVLLVILDGFGINNRIEKNAVKTAKMPNYNNFLHLFPHTELQASGEFVGLPKGYMGNSEVGHMTIGSGRIIKEDITRINEEILNYKIYENDVLKNAMLKVKKKDKKLHLLGLISDAGVHSHIAHLFGLLMMAKHYGLNKVLIHAFTDGRDTNIFDGLKYVKDIERFCKKHKIGKIATIIGRYFAMDRDHRWDRTKRAYDLLTYGAGTLYKNTKEGIKSNYKHGFSDEFIRPSLVEPEGLIEKEDGVIFFNFRTDRPRQLTEALTQKDFHHFNRKTIVKNFVCMTEYNKKFNLPVAYPPLKIKNTLGEVFSKLGKRQLRIAETEKYAHVTFFFNNGREKPFSKEDRILVPSPKVATYNQAPEMSAKKITEKVLREIKSQKYELIVMNFANPDMVGHTGYFEATVKGLEVVDNCLGRIYDECKKNNYLMLITADHGNCEDMSGVHRTTHTTNKVHFIVCDNKIKLKKGNFGLSSIAPTILKLKNYKIPKEMRGIPLV